MQEVNGNAHVIHLSLIDISMEIQMNLKVIKKNILIFDSITSTKNPFQT